MNLSENRPVNIKLRTPDQVVILVSNFIYMKFLSYILLSILLIVGILRLDLFPVWGAASPFSQTDWSGGSDQTSYSDSTKFSSSSNVTTSVSGQITLNSAASWCNNSYCNSSWLYRKKITFNNTDGNLGVTSENLVNFPVLVKLSSSNIDYSKTQNSGQDIRFTDTDGSDLAYEIEKWDETGTSYVWVNVPQIDINSSTDYIYLYYGNASASDHQQATSTWNTNYAAVWHLEETGSGNLGDYNDSTSNNNDGQGGGGTADYVPSPSGSGKINGAQSFDGSNDYIQVSHTDSINPTAKISIEGWLNLDTTNDTYLISKGVNTRYEFRLWRVDDTNAYIQPVFVKTDGSFYYVSSQTATISTSSWNYIAYTFESSTNEMKVFINGSAVSDPTISVLSASYGSSDDICIGCRNNNNFIDGQIDDIRISNNVRSAAWIAASYKSETDIFNTYNSEESQVQTSGTLTSSIYDAGYSDGVTWGTLTYNATTPSNTSVTVRVRTSNSSSMTGAIDFSSCNAIDSDSDISSNNCVSDGQRYIQYQITLTNTDSVSTPTFQDISISFAVPATSSTSSSSTSTASSVSTPQIPKENTSKVVKTTVDSNMGNQTITAILESNTFNFDSFLSVQVVPASQLTSSGKSNNNIILAGGNILGIKSIKTIAWQVGNILQIWYKAYSPGLTTINAPYIIPSLQKKPSIIALSYKDSNLIPPGQPDKPFKSTSLKLAHSLDGVNWTILPNSVVDTNNKTVSVVSKVGGYYMIVATSDSLITSSSLTKPPVPTEQIITQSPIPTTEKEKTPEMLPSPTPSPKKSCFLFWCR